jgi:hypothetical protein
MKNIHETPYAIETNAPTQYRIATMKLTFQNNCAETKKNGNSFNYVIAMKQALFLKLQIDDYLNSSSALFWSDYKPRKCGRAKEDD